MDKDLKEIQEVNNTYYKLTSDLLLSGVDPLMIAGVMTAAGMQLYKQAMTTEEFNRIKRVPRPRFSKYIGTGPIGIPNLMEFIV